MEDEKVDEDEVNRVLNEILAADGGWAESDAWKNDGPTDFIHNESACEALAAKHGIYTAEWAMSVDNCSVTLNGDRKGQGKTEAEALARALVSALKGE